MTLSLSTPQPKVSRILAQRNADSPQLWLSAIVASLAIHLTLGWMLRFLLLEGQPVEQSGQNVIPIEMVAIASPKPKSPARTQAKPSQRRSETRQPKPRQPRTQQPKFERPSRTPLFAPNAAPTRGKSWSRYRSNGAGNPANGSLEALNGNTPLTPAERYERNRHVSRANPGGASSARNPATQGGSSGSESQSWRTQSEGRSRGDRFSGQRRTTTPSPSQQTEPWFDDSPSQTRTANSSRNSNNTPTQPSQPATSGNSGSTATAQSPKSTGLSANLIGLNAEQRDGFNITQPAKLKRQPPSYLLPSGIELQEEVVLKTIVEINANGQPIVHAGLTQVMQGNIAPDKAGQLAKQVIEQWEFNPTYKEGQPHLHDYQIEVRIRPVFG